MNYKKFWYKAENSLIRRWIRHPLLFINDDIKISFQMASMQTLLIASQQYHEKDMPCRSYNLETKEWKDDIIKANKESKEEFEVNKNIAIAEYWVNFALSVVNVWSIGLTGKENNLEKFDLKKLIIKDFIIQLKKLMLTK